MIIDNLYAPEKTEKELSKAEMLVNKIMARGKTEEDCYRIRSEVVAFIDDLNNSEEDKAEVEQYTECLAMEILGIEFEKAAKKSSSS